MLSRTTPHQSPESITHYMGLDHYADSLRKLLRFEGIELALGSHEDAIHDLYGRINAIRASHNRKLDRIRKIMRDQRRAYDHRRDFARDVSRCRGLSYSAGAGRSRRPYRISISARAFVHREFEPSLKREPNPAILYELHD